MINRELFRMIIGAVLFFIIVFSFIGQLHELSMLKDCKYMVKEIKEMVEYNYQPTDNQQVIPRDTITVYQFE